MAFIAISGVDLKVVEDSFVQRAPLYQGGRERMRGGNIVSTESNPMRIWEFQIDVDSAEEEAAIRAVCPRGVAVNVFFGAESGAALIDLGDGTVFQHYNQDGYAFYKRIPVRVEETVVL